MGIGTIVGSAMFNILVIVALSCAVAGQSGASLLIDWRPVARDVTYYTLSIVMMAVFFDDGTVTVAEAFIMVLAYISYIVFMMFNEKIMAQCSSKVHTFGLRRLRCVPGGVLCHHFLAAYLED